jgi:hypothetical protein
MCFLQQTNEIPTGKHGYSVPGNNAQLQLAFTFYPASCETISRDRPVETTAFLPAQWVALSNPARA